MIRLCLIAAITLGVACAPGTGSAPSGAPAAVEREPCVVPPKGEPMMCTQQYEPVCGCDGRTYGNACTATSQGVRRHRPGRCDNADDPRQ